MALIQLRLVYAALESFLVDHKDTLCDLGVILADQADCLVVFRRGSCSISMLFRERV